MKKPLSLTLALALLCGSLAACSSNSAPAPAPAASSAEASVAADAASTEAAPAEAATEATTEAATEEVDDTADPVAVAAMEYFENFPKMADYGNNAIPSADLFAKIDAEEDMLIVDIRQAADYAEGHLKGAVNIPYQDIPSYLEQIPDDKPVFVNCYSGQTSSQTVALLNIAGKYAVNIQSGWNRGISKAEGFDAYVETDENTLEDGSYPVDADIAAAITDYYAEADGHNYKYFNFPVDDLKELVDAESDAYTILSVRQAKDYAEGHIAGAINIPFGQGMQAQFPSLPDDKPIIVYCYTGQTASQVMAVLRMLGFEAYNLNGGMGSEGNFGWLENGYRIRCGFTETATVGIDTPEDLQHAKELIKKT